MKNKYFLSLGWCMLAAAICFAQDVTYSFQNAQNTNSGGVDYYEVDVMVSTSAPFKMGSGQLYFNFNPAAFGTNIFTNNKVETTYPNTDFVLGQKDNWLGVVFVYGDFVENDNLPSRYSFSWQQSKEGDCIDINVTATPAKLFHLKIEYADVNQSPDVCFESSALFTDQTFTHCGNNNGTCGLADEDCINEPGTQITNDIFDCSGAALLPLELLLFYASPSGDTDVLLEWETANEINTSHFEIERSNEGSNWQAVGSVLAAGNSSENLHYNFVDRNVTENDGLAHDFYYRLRMVDLDGSFEYSGVRHVDFKSQRANLFLFPNPTSWGFNVGSTGNAEEIANLEVETYAMDGRLIFKENIVGLHGEIQFPESMRSGVYQVRVRDMVSGNELIEKVVLAR